MKQTWEKPRTSRVYLHAPGANRIVMAHPDFKITDLDLQFIPRHTRQSACGVHILAGKTHPDALDFHTTVFDPPMGGLPLYTMRNTDPENGCAITMQTFATAHRLPVTYGSILVENTENDVKTGRIGILPRAVRDGDQYLTGLWDTGYESYQPNLRQWYLCRQRRMVQTGSLFAAGEDGYGNLRILACNGCTVRWISRDEQKNRFEAHDYFACDYTVEPGESVSVDFAFCSGALSDTLPSFDEALDAFTAYWNEWQARIRLFPETDASRIQDMYRQNVTQCLQMFQTYQGKDGIIVRQGDVGRYIWVWEAIHILGTLDRIGDFSPLTEQAYEEFCSWLSTEGENRGRFTYRYVGWDNGEGALLLGLAMHLLYAGDAAQYEKFLPTVRLLIETMEERRHSDTSDPVFCGLYPAGQASDWGEIGRHWIWTDAFQTVAYRVTADMFAKYDTAEAEKMKVLADDYRACCLRTFAHLKEGHENDRSFIIPHIAGLDFERSYNHCFATDGALLLPVFGIMDANDPAFAQMEAFYAEIGLVNHDLYGRLTNATDPGVGVYGDCYYTGEPDMAWVYSYLARGNYERADAIHNAILRYNVTDEYITSERYTPCDPWYTPWQPNGSGAGRLVWYLLDYYDAKKHGRTDAYLFAGQKTV